MRKVFSVLALLVVVCGLLSGCREEQTSEKPVIYF